MDHNLDGGLNPFSPEPQVDLKGSKLPWPVYLAIGLAGLAVIGFLAIHAYQTRERRKVHAAFMQEFADFEKDDVNAFWRCLFGKEGDARRFSNTEGLNATLETTFATDVKGFPDKVQNECIPKAIKAADKIKTLNPPDVYRTAMDNYGKALAGLANTMNVWAEGAPKRFAVRQQEKKVKDFGAQWAATGNLRKPEPEALQFDRFLHCSVPDIDKIKDPQGLIDVLAQKCLVRKNQVPDAAFLTQLKDKCIPEALQPAPARPTATFAGTLQRIAPEYDREEKAWDTCFRAMRKDAKKDDYEGLDKTWADEVNASTEVRKIGKEQLKDD